MHNQRNSNGGGINNLPGGNRTGDILAGRTATSPIRREHRGGITSRCTQFRRRMAGLDSATRACAYGIPNIVLLRKPAGATTSGNLTRILLPPDGRSRIIKPTEPGAVSSSGTVGLAESLAFYYPEHLYYENPAPLWINPTTGRISSPAGIRYSPITGQREFHDGVDIAIPVGTPIIAPKDGRVVASGYSQSFGHFLRLAHDDGYTTFYAHLSRVAVAIGDIVAQGDRVAYSGNTGMSTGPHLHFGIFHNGQFLDPMARLDFQP